MKDKRDLLNVLKDELAYVEGGGYQWDPKRPGQPPRLFMDSPACINFNDPARSRPCSDCVLSLLAPREGRMGPFPCQHISLNSIGDTPDSLSRYKGQDDLGMAAGYWLRATVARLEDLEVRRQGNRELTSGYLHGA